jgi:hypothetical protein
LIGVHVGCGRAASRVGTVASDEPPVASAHVRLHGGPSVLPVFLMGLEDTLGVGVKQHLAGPQPRLRVGGQRRAVKVELADLLQPSSFFRSTSFSSSSA